MTTADIVFSKANGFVGAIKSMSNKERESLPSGHYGEDYNSLRKMTLEGYPELEEAMPPAVAILPAARGSQGTIVQATYLELLTYVLQIVNLVKAEDAARR